MKQSLPLYYVLITIYLVLTGLVVHAQTPAWQAATAITSPGTGSAYANATAADAAGNVYVAGQFSGTVTLGTITFTAAANSGNNGFIAKWNPALQRFSWAQQVGGSVTGVAVAGANVYATGYFSSTADFGGTTLSSAGDYDIFVVKLLDAGASSTFGWAKQAGGTGLDRAETIAATGSGVYVGGQFAQSAAFGAILLTGNNGSNGFVAKLTDGGSTAAFTWAQQVVSSSATSVVGLAAAGSAVYMTGQFAQTATFGSLMLSSATGATAYVAKLIDDGATSSFNWAQAPTVTAGNSLALGVAVAGANVYVAGRFSGTISFGSQSLTSVGLSDICVAKLTDGNFVWAQQAGGPGDDSAQEVAVAGSSVYVTGSFRESANFGTTSLTSGGGGDVFVTKLTDSGPAATFAWTQQAGGPGNDDGRSIALSSAGPVVAGSFNATASFGAQTITNAALYSENAFLALLASGVLATGAPAALPQVACFPNPAHTTTTIRLPALLGDKQVAITLFDAVGRAVRTQSVRASTATIDLVGLTPGIYALRVQGSEGVAPQKLIIE